MTGDQIKVTFDQIGTAEQDCRRTKSDMDTRLQDLAGQLTPLVSDWTGDAATNYQALKKQWDTAAEGLSGILNDIAGALFTAKDNYQQTEQANAQIWQQA